VGQSVQKRIVSGKEHRPHRPAPGKVEQESQQRRFIVAWIGARQAAGKTRSEPHGLFI
jgi:hypothetical protein